MVNALRLLAPLDRKLARDLWHLRAQVLAIAMVIASGVAVIVMSLTAVEALDESAKAYYERYRFAHVFADLKRAPERMVNAVRKIPGVQSVQTRVVKPAIVEVAHFPDPIVGHLVSIPEGRPATLNQMALSKGRRPAHGKVDEVIVSVPFAEAHRLQLGDTIGAVINGHRRTLTIVGTALSPEFVYTIAPGALMPDDQRFGVIWMSRKALAVAWDLEGSFNNLTIATLRGVEPKAVIERVDDLLAPYGGIGAYARSEQISNWFLMNELEQLAAVSSILPVIFICVAAFLTNMVLSRLVAVERGEIGVLKAFGYSNFAVGMHYIKLMLAIGVLGCVIGWVAGYQLGHLNTSNYAEFFRFPVLIFEPGPKPFALGAAISLLAALAGTLSAVRRAVRLPPAEAMRPPTPTRFRHSSSMAKGRRSLLDQPTRIVLRQLARWPIRSMLASAGVGMAVAVLILALQWLDAIELMVDSHFATAQHQDVTVGFDRAQPKFVANELLRLPGVIHAEGMRIVPARLHNGVRNKLESIQALPSSQSLYEVYDVRGRRVTLPDRGVVLSTMLAERLSVSIGDRVRAQILERHRPEVELVVVDIIETYIGTPAYMEISALHRTLGEMESYSAVHLKVDPRESARLYEAIRSFPSVTAVTVRQAAIRNFEDTLGETVVVYTTFFVVFACLLAIGVSYNAARIALSERGRELATMRVIGFSTQETGYILLGEVALLTALAMPLGCAFGYGLAVVMADAFTTELFRIPIFVSNSTYAWSMLVVLLATAVALGFVGRRVSRLNLIAVLKTRE